MKKKAEIRVFRGFLKSKRRWRTAGIGSFETSRKTEGGFRYVCGTPELQTAASRTPEIPCPPPCFFMDSFFSFLKFAVLCAAGLSGLVLILLSLPGSKLGSRLVQVFGWIVGLVASALVLSPIDFVPDFIPVLGQADDLLYLGCAVASFWIALRQRKLAGETVPLPGPESGGATQEPPNDGQRSSRWVYIPPAQPKKK
jgi:hypothetical protein